MFNDCRHLFFTEVTTVKTYIHCFHVLTRQERKVWAFKDDPTSTVMK